jgi:hypothetical protein
MSVVFIYVDTALIVHECFTSYNLRLITELFTIQNLSIKLLTLNNLTLLITKILYQTHYLTTDMCLLIRIQAYNKLNNVNT